MMLNNLSEHLAVSEENQRLRLRLMGAGELGPMIGQSRAMRRVMALIEQVAPSSASVIIQRRKRHRQGSRRAHHPRALAARAAALTSQSTAPRFPKTLLESELFGHERGAFTGADRRREGCFELANGGTLLLDEIGEMKPELQAKLLRVLEERKLRRVGGTGDIALDVRVLAATNRDLAERSLAGRFREDLYYRLNVFTIVLPPLERAPRGYAGAGRSFRARLRSRELQADQWRGQRLSGSVEGAAHGPATCASCATSSSAP